jgi:hypothetical protein
VVDPHKITSGKSDGIASPDVLWVELRNVDVPACVRARPIRVKNRGYLLDDNVLGSVRNSQTLASDDTGASDADD